MADDWKGSAGKIILALGTVLFITWGTITFFAGNKELIYDRYFTAALFLVTLIFYRKIRLSLAGVLIGTATLAIHHMKFYGMVFFGWLEFDMIMHVLAGFAIAFIMHRWLKGEKEDWWREHKLFIGFIVFFFSFGISSFNEIIEYFGYALLGSGEGILFYGAGDFGEYADTALDMTSNAIGALLAVLLKTAFLMMMARYGSGRYAYDGESEDEKIISKKENPLSMKKKKKIEMIS